MFPTPLVIAGSEKDHLWHLGGHLGLIHVSSQRWAANSTKLKTVWRVWSISSETYSHWSTAAVVVFRTDGSSHLKWIFYLVITCVINFLEAWIHSRALYHEVQFTCAFYSLRPSKIHMNVTLWDSFRGHGFLVLYRIRFSCTSCSLWNIKALSNTLYCTGNARPVKYVKYKIMKENFLNLYNVIHKSMKEKYIQKIYSCLFHYSLLRLSRNLT